MIEAVLLAGLVTFALLAALLSGCQAPQSARQSAVTAPSLGTAASFRELGGTTVTHTGATAIDKEPEGTAAGPATKVYTYAARAEFVRDMLRDLALINQALQELFIKVEDSSEKAVTKGRRRAKLIALVDRAAGLTIDLDKVSTVQEAVWEQAKASSKQSNDEFRASVAVARVSLGKRAVPGAPRQ